MAMDSLGKDSFTYSLDCLRPLGIMISFGDLSGSLTGLDLGMLAQRVAAANRALELSQITSATILTIA